MLQLRPTIPLLTPKGAGDAHFAIDDGAEHDLLWVVFLRESGECWTFQNQDVRLEGNLTLGREQPRPAWRDCWRQEETKRDGSPVP